MPNGPATTGVLYSEKLGVFLGSFMGMEMWSRLDPAGQTAAILFENREQARKYASNWGRDVGALRFVPVTSSTRDVVNIEECVTAGLPGWDPSVRTDGVRLMGPSVGLAAVFPHAPLGEDLGPSLEEMLAQECQAAVLLNQLVETFEGESWPDSTQRGRVLTRARQYLDALRNEMMDGSTPPPARQR